MFAGLISCLIAGALFWLIGWGMQLERSSWHVERRIAAFNMLFCWAWPLLSVCYFLYGVFYLIKVVLGIGDKK